MNQDNLLEIANGTESLRIVSGRIEEDLTGGNLMVIEIQNIGSLPIVAYSLQFDEGPCFTKDLADSDRYLNPGETDFVMRARATPDPVKVKVKLVYFIDDSTEGEARLARERREHYRGIDLAIEQLDPLIRPIIELAPPDPRAIRELFEALEPLQPPARLGAIQRQGYRDAINQVRYQTAGLLRHQQSGNPERAFDEFKTCLERRIERSRARRQESRKETGRQLQLPAASERWSWSFSSRSLFNAVSRWLRDPLITRS
ncbi:MAG TPA: hypothetical protein VJ302_05755 [Blastocatellia bacterium]|nr:hypothetical protein [Blastocatellia bacterium]